MDISRVLQYLLPQAIQPIDYIVQDNGSTPVLRLGIDGLFRFPLRPLAEDETEEIEGIHYRMAVDYKRLTLGVDYDIVERGPYIVAWNLPQPQPTEAELQATWDAIKDLPPEPTPQTDTDRVDALEAENKLLKAQNQALSDRADFIEDIIAEMAMRVYR